MKEQTKLWSDILIISLLENILVYRKEKSPLLTIEKREKHKREQKEMATKTNERGHPHSPTLKGKP